MLATTAIATMMAASNVYAQSSVNLSSMKKPFFEAGAGKFNLTANVGYVHNFASKWDSEIGNGKANGGFGYGARLGWTHSSGFGISGDYLGFTSKWSSDGLNYENPYHVLTITPSYRVSFGDNKEWGLKVGLGVGMSLADVSWGTAQTAKGAAGKVAGGAVYKSTTETGGGATGWGMRLTFDVEPFIASASSPALGVRSSVFCANYIVADKLGNGASSSATIKPNEVCRGQVASDAKAITGTLEVNQKWLLGQKRIATYDGGTKSDITDNDIVSDIKLKKIVWVKDKIAADVWSAVITETDATKAQNVVDVLKAAAAGWTSGAGEFEAKSGVVASDAVKTILNAGAAGSDVEKLKNNLLALGVRFASNTVSGQSGSGGQSGLGGQTIPSSLDGGASGGKAKDDAGFVLAPEIALEYDNGLLHADINARYIHGLANVKYDGSNGTANQLQKSGPLAVFVGAGFGVNF